MTNVIASISISVDGFLAGPDPSVEAPLGKGGEELHQWALAASAWRQQHGRDGGAENEESALIRALGERVGAGVMGRRMFSSGSGGWEDDPRASGWWGDEPPFHHDVFVLTHHPREPLALDGTTFHFVTDGIEAAIARARDAAGGKDVQIHGGGSVVSQALRAGLLDELTISVAPRLLGGGAPLLDAVAPAGLRRTSTLVAPSGVTHITYAVAK